MITFKYFNTLTREQKFKVDEIFFDTSSIKIFEDDEAKKKFHQKYLGIYQQKYEQHFICALQDDEVIGYICGALDSINEKELYVCLTHFNVFEDFYIKYPAHLHINMSRDASGKGAGSKLIEKYEEHLIEHKVSGVHLITSPSARNVHFYQKNNYSFTCERNFKGHPLLFMGKNLTV